MAGVRIKVDAREVREVLQRLRRAGKRLRPAFVEIGEHMQDVVDRRFTTERGPGGVAWKPLLLSSYANKPSLKKLTNTRRLRESIIYSALQHALIQGTNVVYAAIHQLGGKTPSHVIKPKRKKALAWLGGLHPVKSVQHPGSRIPARPYLGFDDDDIQESVEIISDHIQRAIDGRV